MKKIFSLISVFVLGVSTSAFAQSEPDSPAYATAMSPSFDKIEIPTKSWNNSLLLSRTSVNTTQSTNANDTIDITFEIKPASAYISISGLKTTELYPGSYDVNKRMGMNIGNYNYNIFASTINKETNVGTGVIRIKRDKKRSNADCGNVIIQLKNPVFAQTPNGQFIQYTPTIQTLSLDIR
jgi:hypothetical protein